MKKWLQKLFGIDVVINTQQYQIQKLLVIAEDLSSLQKSIDDRLEQERELTRGNYTSLYDMTELRTKSVQKEVQLLSKQMLTFEKTLIGTIIPPEENDIEKDTSSEIDVTDDMRIPIVSGMKVRFETEGVETDIHID